VNETYYISRHLALDVNFCESIIVDGIYCQSLLLSWMIADSLITLLSLDFLHPVNGKLIGVMWLASMIRLLTLL